MTKHEKARRLGDGRECISFPSSGHYASLSQLRSSGKSRGMPLYTIGYEGMTIASFLNRLKDHNVNLVLDVRELPLSRKPGFSKRSFAAALSDAGISYTHIPSLGCPKEIRDRYKSDHNWAVYAVAFSKYLETQASAISIVREASATSSACLVCFEADFRRCHRSLVARAADATVGGGITHIDARTKFLEARPLVAA